MFVNFEPIVFVRELDPNLRFIAKNGTELLVQLDDSVLGLPEPLLSVGLRVFRCLDKVTLGLLLVVLW